jgi:hypothetical protein
MKRSSAGELVKELSELHAKFQSTVSIGATSSHQRLQHNADWQTFGHSRRFKQIQPLKAQRNLLVCAEPKAARPDKIWFASSCSSQEISNKSSRVGALTSCMNLMLLNFSRFGDKVLWRPAPHVN